MTFIDILEKAGDIPEAAYIKFLHQYKIKDKTVHVFFEGAEDQSFYAGFIENIFPSDYIFYYYISNGKENVYVNYQDINWDVYNKNRVLFFTDKDLDDILGISRSKDENIYETKYYSMENYLVSTEVYGRFLREICFITDDDLIKELKITFAKELENFSAFITRLSAWVIYCRRSNLPVNLNDIDVSKIFALSEDFKVLRKVSSGHKTAFEYVCSTTKSKYYNLKEIKSILVSLDKIRPEKKYIRGKYELWFLYALCKNTIDTVIPHLNKKIKQHNRINKEKKLKCKVTIDIKPENLIQIVAPRVRIPEDVAEFLNENLKKLIIHPLTEAGPAIEKTA